MTHGLMGFGQVPDDQAPVRVGALTQTNPILASASVIASDVMLRMAAVPRSERLSKMVEILNRGERGLGDAARVAFVRAASSMPPGMKDQAMFDAIRTALSASLASKVLKSSPLGIAHLTRGGGLGQTIAEAQGRTSQAINDANALFCSYGAGIGAMVGGFAAQFGSGSGQTASAGITGATSAGTIAGCGAGQLVIQGQIATQQAQLAQNGVAQTIAMQQAADSRFMRFTLLGAGLIGALGIGFMALKKKQ